MTNAPQRHTWFWPHPGPLRFSGVCLAARSRAHVHSCACTLVNRTRCHGCKRKVFFRCLAACCGSLLADGVHLRQSRRQECNDRCICVGLPARSNHPARNVLWNGPARTLTSPRQGWRSGRRGPSTNHVSRQRPDTWIGGVVCWPQVSCRRPCRCVASAGAGPLADQSGLISDDHTFWPSVPAVDTTFTVNGAVADVTAPFCMNQ